MVGRAEPRHLRLALRSTISCQLARSCVRSTAGGTEVSEAAAKKIENPMPISTSAKRFMLRDGGGGVGAQALGGEEIAEAECQQHQQHADLGADHHAIRRAVEAGPVCRYRTTPSPRRRRRSRPRPPSTCARSAEPMRRQAAPSCTRASAMTKQGMPPIQIAAPNWCSASTASSRLLSASRASACVVNVAATSSTSPSAISSGPRRADQQEQHADHGRRADLHDARQWRSSRRARSTPAGRPCRPAPPSASRP